MKVTVFNKREVLTTAQYMNVGDIAKIFQPGHRQEGHMLLRSYSGYVSLNDPSKTWENPREMEVIILPKGTKIELEVE